MDEHVEVTRVSWFSRIGESVKGVLIGLLLFVASFPLLWWNEGRAVQTAQSLDEGAGAVRAVASDKVDAANEGKLVHLAGVAQTTDLLRDEDFGIEQKGIKLVRSVEMYQWVESKKTEKEKKVGGAEEQKTTYKYEQQWSSASHDSSDFKVPAGHTNPKIQYEVRTRVAQNVTLGAFTIPEAMVQQIEGATPLTVDGAAVAKLTPTLQGITRAHDGAFYLRPGAADASFDPTKPEVGDHRVRFTVVPAAEVSLVAQQKGSSFAPYQTKAGDPISMIRTGTHTAADMFKAAEEANTTLTWILRAVGFLLMAFGAGLVFRPLVVVADVVPLIGSVVGFGTFFASLAIAVPLSALTIGLAWVAARPLLGIALLVGTAAAIALVVVAARKRKAARRVAPAAESPAPGAAG